MNEALIGAICGQQSHGGAFVSTVTLPTGHYPDYNCFVTGLVLRELANMERERRAPLPAALREARRRALGFLTRSTYPVYRYGFGFYPHRAQPFWMPVALRAHADDTAVAALELVRGGVWPTHALTIIAENYLHPHRAEARHLTESFHRRGAFLTWFGGSKKQNDIDLCVNANVVSLLAYSGQRHRPGYQDAVAMIVTGIRAATLDRGLIPRLSPYYPTPRELLAALRHACFCGATELEQATEDFARIADAGSEVVFSNIAGDITWKAPVLQLLRRVRPAIESGACLS